MIITPELWNISVTAIQSIAGAPVWLKRQAQLNYEGALGLPSAEAAGEGVDAIPSAEQRIVKADYFDFLREQIKLEPRGPEWGQILNKRLADMEPFADKKLIRIIFHSKPHVAVLEINPETSEVIHVEID
jgi:hypothetical protein